jgi:hypothetical protein
MGATTAWPRSGIVVHGLELRLIHPVDGRWTRTWEGREGRAMAEEPVRQGVPGRHGGGAEGHRGRRAPVVAFTPEQQWWLDAEVRPVVEQVAAELAGAGADGRARRHRQRWAWGLVVGLVAFGVLVGAVLARSLAIVP